MDLLLEAGANDQFSLKLLIGWLKTLPPDAVGWGVDQLLGALDDRALETLLYDWSIWARPSQRMPPGDWFIWLILAGRGYGKTKTGSETVRERVELGKARRIALIAPDAGAGRDVMIEGDSGILACSPPWFYPKYEPSKKRITWPNGAVGHIYSAEDPDDLRGPQHDFAWADEPASWVDEGLEVWSNLMLGLRLGKDPRAVVTGTPKPTKLVLKLVEDKTVHITRGSTYENAANLAERFLAKIRELYEGTRLGDQEVYAKLLLDMPGALFNLALVDRLRVKEPPQLSKIVIAIDPAPTSEEGSDETGIMAVGKGPAPAGLEPLKPGIVGEHGYVLKDHTCAGGPDAWARAAVKAFYEHKAEYICAETNNGGEMVEAVLRTVDPNIPYKAVRAMRGKAKRAEPIAAMYEQGRVHHVGNDFEKLEKQMRVFTGINGRRDDRTDAMCWGMHELLIGSGFAFV